MLILAASASYSALFISVFDPKELPGIVYYYPSRIPSKTGNLMQLKT